MDQLGMANVPFSTISFDGAGRYRSPSHGRCIFFAPGFTGVGPINGMGGPHKLHFSAPTWITSGSFTFQHRAELVEWINGRGLAPLPELASRPSLLPTTPPLDNVAAPSTWDNSINQTDPSSLPNRHVLPPTAADARNASQTTPTTPPIPPSSLAHLPSRTNYSSTDLVIRFLKPLPTQGCAVVLSRIETHVYLDIDLPSRSWGAIQLPLTKSVTRDDSSTMGERIRPLLLAVVVRGATTRQEYHSVCGRCEKRMGNKAGPPSMIDFHSPSNVLTPKRGMVRVHFTFSCYSRHHRKEDEEFVLEVILKDTSNPPGPRVVSRKELPYSFDVRSSRPRPTSDQRQQPNTEPSSDVRRGTTNERPRLVHKQC